MRPVDFHTVFRLPETTRNWCHPPRPRLLRLGVSDTGRSVGGSPRDLSRGVSGTL